MTLSAHAHGPPRQMTPVALHRSAIVALITCVGAIGCAPSDTGGAGTASAERHCFRNVYPFEGDRGSADTLELSLVVEGDSVTGTYSWLPAFKDRRVGSLQGTVGDGVIAATYTFFQEGATGSARITIALEETRALVEGGAPELGLGGEIERVECSDVGGAH